MTATLSRRRLLTIGATSLAALALTGAGLAQPARRWSGQALGAHASIALLGVDATRAEADFAAVEAEIRRLEGQFSLYRADSALMILNATGHLDAPGPDMLALFTAADRAHRLTLGLFDPTVQPLFALYARHLAGGDGRLPGADELAGTLGRVGWDGVRYDEAAIRFDRPGMALTFNGIAQGFVTDRIAALLRRRGYGNMLIDIGEIAAVGAGRDGLGWKVGLASDVDGRNAPTPVRLVDRAVATSMPFATVLDADGRVGHIFHPRLGAVRPEARAVSVIADSAALADALSTAAVLMDDASCRALTGHGVEIRRTV